MLRAFNSTWCGTGKKKAKFKDIQELESYLIESIPYFINYMKGDSLA